VDRGLYKIPTAAPWPRSLPREFGSIAICTAKPYNKIVIFIETTAFTKYVYTYLTDDEFLGLQSFLLRCPESGKIVPGSGGVRKIRWQMAGKGKRGGVRIIYYFKKQDDEIWLLTIYSKSKTDKISAHVLRQIAEEIKYV
jgi:mRNA-degrading endonuclease RelE of RelBE toxin-antitoxin system